MDDMLEAGPMKWQITIDIDGAHVRHYATAHSRLRTTTVGKPRMNLVAITDELTGSHRGFR